MTRAGLTVGVNDGDELGHAVRTPADLASLSTADRLRLTGWLAAASTPTRLSPDGQRRRRRVLLTASGAAGVLIPWTVVLATTLPDRHGAREWRAAWVGFDIALAIGFAATAWFGWRGRQVVISCLWITATLLLCDAWFDILLSWGGRGQIASVVTALVVEVPLALFLLATCYRILRALTAQAWRDNGRPGRPPPLRQVPLLLRVDGAEAVSLDQQGP